MKKVGKSKRKGLFAVAVASSKMNESSGLFGVSPFFEFLYVTQHMRRCRSDPKSTVMLVRKSILRQKLRVQGIQDNVLSVGLAALFSTLSILLLACAA